MCAGFKQWAPTPSPDLLGPFHSYDHQAAHNLNYYMYLQSQVYTELSFCISILYFSDFSLSFFSLLTFDIFFFFSYFDFNLSDFPSSNIFPVPGYVDGRTGPAVPLLPPPPRLPLPAPHLLPAPLLLPALPRPLRPGGALGGQGALGGLHGPERTFGDPRGPPRMLIKLESVNNRSSRRIESVNNRSLLKLPYC